MYDAGITELDDIRNRRLLKKSGQSDSKQVGNGEIHTAGASEGSAQPEDGSSRDPPSEKEKFLRSEVAALLEQSIAQAQVSCRRASREDSCGVACIDWGIAGM